MINLRFYLVVPRRAEHFLFLKETGEKMGRNGENNDCITNTYYYVLILIFFLIFFWSMNE